MASKRILLLCQDSLLAQGLLSLLREQPGLEAEARQLKSPVQEFVRQFAPDVVIIDGEDFARHATITIDQLLREQPQLKVIDVSSRDDVARIYEGYQIKVAKFEDLLATLAATKATDWRG